MFSVDLSRRALPHELPEWMDEPCSFEDFQACLRDIARVNRLTLAHRPTILWLDEVRRRRPSASPLRIVDVGCGYGDALRRIQSWARTFGIAVELTGIDLNPHAVRAAREATRDGTIEWLHGDAYALDPNRFDIIITSLMTHHLEDPEIVRLLQWMESTARVGWFIHDLHRTPIPYYAFALWTLGLRLHRFNRHDGLVSIRRSFRREDWERLCALAGFAPGGVTIQTYRPARLCVSHIQTDH